jgi:hypothetical protein
MMRSRAEGKPVLPWPVSFEAKQNEMDKKSYNTLTRSRLLVEILMGFCPEKSPTAEFSGNLSGFTLPRPSTCVRNLFFDSGLVLGMTLK